VIVAVVLGLVWLFICMCILASINERMKSIDRRLTGTLSVKSTDGGLRPGSLTDEDFDQRVRRAIQRNFERGRRMTLN
jgi:hypothetical protein